MPAHEGAACIGLAVSGGADSLALLLLAHAVMPGRIVAASVDHGLRPEAPAECEFVAEVCARLSVPHDILTVELAAGNLQQEARRARYAALYRWALDRKVPIHMMATAHHLDDQVETMTMRLNRGSGLSGLRGIRTFADIAPEGGEPVVAFRPLLGWRRAELADIVEKAGLVPVSDPSNSDSRFDRARLRKHLADTDWLDREGWGRSAALLAEAERALQYFLIEERLTLMKMIDPTDPKWVFVRPDRPARPDYADIEQVVYYFTLFDAEISRSDASSLVKKLKRNRGGNFAGVLVTPGEYQGKPAWIFQREPPRKTG